MRKPSLVLVIAAALAACNHSPTAPSPPSNPAPPDAHSTPLPGGGEFKWWVTNTYPAKDSKLEVGQKVLIEFKCSAPPGYSYLIFNGFSRGPGTVPDNGWFSMSHGSGGMTSVCPHQTSDFSKTITSDAPDLPYFRFQVHIIEGETVGGPGTNWGEPKVVIDEYLGWRHPG